MSKTVEIHLLHQSTPIKISSVTNTYQKGSMYCVYYLNEKQETVVDKFPIEHIFRVREGY